MIITCVVAGLGNQLFMYAVGRCLAHRLNTDLKIDIKGCPKDERRHDSYRLRDFNILENIADDEEIQRVKQNKLIEEPSYLSRDVAFMPEALTASDDTYLLGFFQSEKYFIEIEDIIRREFTLKTFEGERSRSWLSKIQSTECAVSLHIRRGDYTSLGLMNLFGVMPFRYYYSCINELKKICPNMTLFIFSDDLNWAKQNVLFDVPTEFVEGCERACDEIFLMSQCKHNVIANSTFSWWGAWLNPNPDKKVFAPDKWFRTHGINQDIIPDSWIKMPVDYSGYPNNNLNHDVSIVIYVHDNLLSTAECLGSIFTQTVGEYECIIIDDASTDGSRAFCRREAEQRANVRLVQTNRPIGRAAAFNLGIDMARNEYIVFIDNRERFMVNAVEYLRRIAAGYEANIFHGVKYFDENPNGELDVVGKKFAMQTDKAFANSVVNGGGVALVTINAFQTLEIISSRQMNNSIGVNMFKRSFLLENFIRFKENLRADCAETLFTVECLFKDNNLILMSFPFCLEYAKEIIAPFPNWQDDFKFYTDAVDKLLSSITDASFKDRLKFHFLKNYWV